MYIHLGEDTAVADSDIIGIFDIENTSVSRRTREFLSSAEKKGNIVYVTYDMPKAYVLCSMGGKEKVYITKVSPMALRKRFNDAKKAAKR